MNIYVLFYYHLRIGSMESEVKHIVTGYSAPTICYWSYVAFFPVIDIVFYKFYYINKYGIKNVMTLIL